MNQNSKEERALKILEILIFEFGMSKTIVAKNLKITRVSLDNVLNRRNSVTPRFLARYDHLIEKLKNSILNDLE